MQKIYRVSPIQTTVAVEDVSFCIKKGECLALLGTSGAGKSTTFKVLTNDVPQTKGEIYINGLDIRTDFPVIRKQIGYGPQYESSNMSLTVRENLEFYSKLKGIPLEKREALIKKLILEMDLDQYENIVAETLSGGNKRKLTVAIALLGNPPIILLDELSTGVDPQAKRFMWTVIQKITSSNKTAVMLTTHSMEEAEALCTKMAMMIGGRFCCIGSPQELKEEFGKGFEIQFNMPFPTEKEEINFLSQFNYELEKELDRNAVISLFSLAGCPDLKDSLTSNGNGSHMESEFKLERKIKAKVVSNYILIEVEAHKLILEIAAEFGDVRVPEHIGNSFKLRVEKRKPEHTIGFLFGFMQDIVEKYNITQYSACQTSLNQIFSTFARQAEYGQEVGKDAMIVKAVDKESLKKNNEIAIDIDKVKI